MVRDYLAMSILDSWNFWFKRSTEAIRIWNLLMLISTKLWQLIWGLAIALFAAFAVKAAYGSDGLQLFLAAFYIRTVLLFTISGIPEQLSSVQNDSVLYHLLAYPIPPRIAVVQRAFSTTHLGSMMDAVLRQRLLYLVIFFSVFHFSAGMIARAIMVFILILALGLPIRIGLIDRFAQSPRGKMQAQLLDMGSIFALITAQGVLYLSVFTRQTSWKWLATLHRYIPAVLSWKDPLVWSALIIWKLTTPRDLVVLGVIGLGTGVVFLWLVGAVRKNLYRIPSSGLAITRWKRVRVRQSAVTPAGNLLWLDKPLTQRLLRFPRFLSLIGLWVYFISQELPVQLLWIIIYPAMIVLLIGVNWIVHQSWLVIPNLKEIALAAPGHALGSVFAVALAFGWALTGQRLLRRYVVLEALGHHFYYFRSFALSMVELVLMRASTLTLLLIPPQLAYGLVSGGWISHSLLGYGHWILVNVLFVAAYALWFVVGSAWMPVFTLDTAQSGISPSTSVMTALTIGGLILLVAALRLIGISLVQTLTIVIIFGTGLAVLAGRHLTHHAL